MLKYDIYFLTIVSVGIGFLLDDLVFIAPKSDPCILVAHFEEQAFLNRHLAHPSNTCEWFVVKSAIKMSLNAKHFLSCVESHLRHPTQTHIRLTPPPPPPPPMMCNAD